MVITFYVSGHGFGHASRSIELIRVLVEKNPAVHITIKTTAPKWLFDVARLPGVRYQACETDVGMTQTDAVTMDVADTARRAAAFYRNFDGRAEKEAGALRADGTRLVLGDIPPLAHAAAARASIPSIGISNFTWDWIYEHYPTFEWEAPGVIQTIGDAYALADRALRLPMHGGFRTFASVTDIPFIARLSTRDPEDTRRRLNVASDRPFVIASFSGYGLQLPFDEIAQREDLTVLSHDTLMPEPLAYPDLVAAADVVVSKPGYGIISECLANNTPLLYTSRGPFAEYDVFVAEMPRVLRCRFMPQEDLRAGRWRPHIDALLAQSDPAERARIDGASVAADEIVKRV